MRPAEPAGPAFCCCNYCYKIVYKLRYKLYCYCYCKYNYNTKAPRERPGVVISAFVVGETPGSAKPQATANAVLDPRESLPGPSE